MDKIERIKENSARFRDLKQAVEKAQVAVDALFDQLENIGALDEYLASGDWLADFEADERGEIGPSVPRDVLSEDGLYNLLDDIHTLRDDMSAFAGSIVYPSDEEASD